MAKLAEYLTGGAGEILEPGMLDNLLSEHGPQWNSFEYQFYGGDAYHAASISDDELLVGGPDWGFSDAFILYRKRRLAVITLLNSEESSPEVVSWAVAKIYDATLEAEESPFVANYIPDPDSLASLVGTYEDDLGFKGTGPRTLVVELDAGKLTGTIWAGDTSTTVEFVPKTSADNFELHGVADQPLARFWRDEAGNPQALSFVAKYGPPFFRVP
jgi:hypothetical protein